ncbi:peptidase domain-containing ABC transporter [Legionella fallonii]|uniref:Xenobiotic-transporting ATPase n=1 Tax=Legionella fallonii LLAP-10 TaxID=1212491 RepID=A0A098G199_9GAMM|nr:ATP-binding cassette domain-containing protein [Legionella fallonii]CEG55759.1 Xenobiotic-transporting ATPase [Legionella fallonii LLAP-10]
MPQFHLKRVKTPILMQMETVDCGAAALGIILAYHRCYMPLEVLRTECLVARDGVSVSNLIKAARRYGMDATVYQQGLFPDIKLPAILFWNCKHYVVLEGSKGNKVYINDPKQGRQVIDWQMFNKQFSGIVIQLQVNADFRKTSKPRHGAVDLLPFFREQRRSLAWLSLSVIMLSLLNVSPLIFTKLFVDKIVSHHGSYSTSWLLAVMSCLLILQLLVSYSSRKLFRVLETRFAVQLSKKLIHHLLHLPLRFFAFRRAGDLVYRIQAVDRLAGAPWSAFCSMVIAMSQSTISFILMFLYSPLLSVIALVGMTIYFAAIKYCQKKWQHIAHVVKARMTELTGLTATYLSTVTQIKAQCSEEVYFVKWQQFLNNYLGAHHQVSGKQQLLQLISLSLFSSGYLGVLVLGIYFVSQNRMTLGEMMACQVLFLSFNEALMHHMKLGHQREQIEADLQSIADITQYPMESIKTQSVVKRQQSMGKIQVVDLIFGYSREFKPLFNQLHLTIEPGTQVALVGASGCGKSTLIHLLAGLYQPWSGTILIDGIPLSDYSIAERARLIGVVGQQQFFYQGSIKENLCLWQDGYSNTEIMAALQMACLDDWITQIEDGLEYQLLDGATNISGGQRQRLEIARTLLAKPPILLLDEATSSLDPLIEEQIKKNLRRYAATKIVVAHRLNTIHDADTLFILKTGQIVDCGSQKQLITKKSPAFAELFALSN